MNSQMFRVHNDLYYVINIWSYNIALNFSREPLILVVKLHQMKNLPDDTAPSVGGKYDNGSYSTL